MNLTGGGEPEGDEQQLAYLQVLHFQPVCALQEVEVLKLSSTSGPLFSYVFVPGGGGPEGTYPTPRSTSSSSPSLYLCVPGGGGPEGKQHLAYLQFIHLHSHLLCVIQELEDLKVSNTSLTDQIDELQTLLQFSRKEIQRYGLTSAI